MKKYLTFFLLILMSIGSVAQTTTTELTVGEEGNVKDASDPWKFRVITGFNDQLMVNDDLVISFDPAHSDKRISMLSVVQQKRVANTRSWSFSVTSRTGSIVKLVRLSVR